jgi:hypothetical protein
MADVHLCGVQVLPARPAQSVRARLFPEAVPPGQKVCNLCEQSLPLGLFKHKYDGSLCSYCEQCDHLVGRGRRRNLSMDAMRAALRGGTLSALLEQSVPQTAPGRAPLAPSKACNLCAQELPSEVFRVVCGGGRCSYCLPCERLVGAGRRRGMPIADLRTSYHAGTLANLLGMHVLQLPGGQRSGTPGSPRFGAAQDRARLGGAGSSSAEGDEVKEEPASPVDTECDADGTHAGVRSLLQAAAIAASQVALEQQQRQSRCVQRGPWHLFVLADGCVPAVLRPDRSAVHRPCARGLCVAASAADASCRGVRWSSQA